LFSRGKTMQIKFIDNDATLMGNEIAAALSGSDYKNFRAAVAFIRQPGLNTIYPSLLQFTQNGGDVLIVAGIDNGITSYQSLSNLLALARLHIHHVSDTGETFHPKVYIFGKTEHSVDKIIVGSSNLTVGGFYRNVEVNVEIDFDGIGNPNTVSDFRKELDKFWNGLIRNKNTILADSRFLSELAEDGRLSDENQLSSFGKIANSLMQSPKKTSRFGNSTKSTSVPTNKNLLATGKIPMGMKKFAMTLSHFDTSPQSQDPVILIPLRALNDNPGFWNFPASYGVSGKHYLEYYTNAKVCNGGKNIVPVRIYAYSGKREFRLQCENIKRNGSKGDIMEIEKVATAHRRAMGAANWYEYKITLHKRGQPAFNSVGGKLSHILQSGKKYGYYK